MTSNNQNRNRVQVIVAAIDQHDNHLPSAMNLHSDALICNQCGKDGVLFMEHDGHPVTFYNSSQRGVGRNRNTGINHATGELLLFADEDVRYVDNYPELVERAFEDHPDADMIIFEMDRKNDPRNLRRPAQKTRSRVRWFSCLRYGASRIAIRRSSLSKANVCFSLLFGGGAPFGSGEDSLFVIECIRKGMCVIAVNTTLGVIDQNTSTWFKGYNERYFHDKGALFYAILGKAYPLLILNFLLRSRTDYRGTFSAGELIRLFRKGKKDYCRFTFEEKSKV